ncbi:hypothetical protein IVB44_06635 [Bradyrhizobium sp. 49]|uniref:hypothetical protein n=1 Tax=unclassified Bradyrhizobium TaxID=2631580 RepID=UPI001FF9D313|nr:MULTISPECIES: hypothetical protein [unclassified Bradyrhizobium]MCK1269166.1 hypothetical protein [Bradyrhizobium sp. 84]MCK1370727.1 hypothetical protein [Bradyrhizobium sp. 49]MCK1585699.1 hypothetical protein [Bradyrhizobium sp. 169]
MSKPFDLLNLYARFSRERKISVTAPQTAQEFLAAIGAQLDKALTDDILIAGQRTAAMFEAMVVALGHYKLMKVEDTGRVYPVGRYRAPDFRIVLEDDEQWLVEVKNVYEADPVRQERQIRTPSYLSSLDSYARATRAALKVAVYWARWGIWTLVSPHDLLDENGYLKLDMKHAVCFNELGRLGDMTIGTTPPLTLRLTADTPNAIGPDGMAPFTVREVTMLSEDRVLTRADEQEIAWIFMNLGEWAEQETKAIVTDGRLSAIEFSWVPEERLNEDTERFEIIGTLSRMFSRHYSQQANGEPDSVQIELEHRPNWFAPLVSSDHKSDALPLWRFIQQPLAVKTANKS